MGTSLSSTWKNLSDTRRGLVLGTACVVLYLVVLFTLFAIGSAQGADVERMLGVHLDDSAEYIGLAHNLLESGRFLNVVDGSPEYFRTPGYPAFLALVFLVFPPVTIPFFQILFTALAVALIYALGTRYFSRTVGLVAAILYMLDPLVMYASFALVTETLFMALFLGSVYAIGTPSRRVWLPFLIAGVLLGLAVLVRPVALYISPLVACILFAHVRPWSKAVGGMSLFFIALAFVTIPWMARNYTQSGHFTLSSLSTFNVYYYNVPLFEQTRTGVPYQDIRRTFNERIGVNDEMTLRTFEYADVESAITREILLAHPIQYTLFHLYKSGLFLIGSSITATSYHLYVHGINPENPPPIGAQGMLLEGRYGDAFVHTLGNAPKLIERLLWLVAYLGAAYLTIVSLWRRKIMAVWVVCAFLLINAFAVMTGPVSDDTRYRIPAEPFLFLLAAAAGAEILSRLQKRV